MNIYWQLASNARQAVGTLRGAVGKPRTASAAVHRLALWTGGLSTAGAPANPLHAQCVSSRERQSAYPHDHAAPSHLFIKAFTISTVT